MADYNILNKSEWQTGLCKCDTESCFLSCIVPCHVYAKIKSTSKSEYCLHLVLYIFLYLSLQQLWYSQHYVIQNTCPSILTNTCITIDEDCNKYYILIDDIKYSCVDNNGYCISNENSCIEQKASTNISLNLFIFSSVCYFMLTCLHYSAREYIKSKQIIEHSYVEDILAIVCCPTCGLAQEYREL
jgi:Cys-rich protein (TIGR01571 family)